MTDELDATLRWTALAYEPNRRALRSRAESAAASLGAGAIDALVSRLHAEHTPPPA